MSTDPTQGDDLEAAGHHLISSRLSLASTVTVVKSLSGGYTDARVFLCDVVSDHVDRGTEVLDGQFILKVGRSTGRPQSEAHEFFCRSLGTFADVHIPKLLMSVQDAGLCV